MEKNKKDIERRALSIAPEALTDGDPEGRKVTGYAAVFNEQSELIFGEFKEIIHPGAFDGVIDRSDVFALLDHDQRRGVLARSKFGAGSLQLSVDEKGLRYEFEAPRTALGDELLEAIRRGDITASSFGFTVREETWVTNGDNTSTRNILKVEELFDVSPVYHPAYTGTSVNARSLSKAKELSGKKKKVINLIKYKF